MRLQDRLDDPQRLLWEVGGRHDHRQTLRHPLAREFLGFPHEPDVALCAGITAALLAVLAAVRVYPVIQVLQARHRSE